MITFPPGEILAELVRSEVVESVHLGHMVLLDATGAIQLSLGEPSALVYPRSTIKSIQASAMVRHGLQLEPRLLALVCSSHSGSPMHQDGALQILALAGLDESALKNAKDKPLGEKDRFAWGVGEPTRLAMNCSGKHSGMLLTCVTNKWSTDDYLDPSHPLQIACREELEILSGEKVSVVSVDGCGAPLFLISIEGLAKAIHAITVSTDPIHSQVVQACRDFPEMVAGEGRLTTRLMRDIPGLFMKEGAEGVEIGSLPDGRTFVFKISDGTNRSFGPLVVAALNEFGVSCAPEIVPVLGGGEVIGSLRAKITRG